MNIIGSTKVWTYTMTGTVPVGCPPEAIAVVIQASVAWSGAILTHLKGSAVKVEDVTPEELSRRMREQVQ